MSGRARSWQNAEEFIDGLEGDLPDEELAAIKQYVERQSREAAHVTVTPVSTVQHGIPHSLTPEIPPDVCVSLEEKDEEGRVNPEPTELELPSAGTGLETPGQQCPPNGETGRTTADGYLLVGMGSNQGGDTSSPAERVGTLAGTATTPANSSNTIFLKASRKPEDNEKRSEENKQFDPGVKGEKPPSWNAAVMVLFSLLEGTLGHGRPAVCASCSLSVCACLSVHYLLFYQVIMSSELKTGEETRIKSLMYATEGQAPSCPSTP